MSCDRASSPMNRVPVSILVPIKNEAENLPRCLASVGRADVVFVIDSQSSDRSRRIAQEHGAQVVKCEFNGTWPKKKHWALEHLPFRSEWTFILDANKVLPAGLGGGISRRDRERGVPDQPRFMFMGRRLRLAYYPN